MTFSATAAACDGIVMVSISCFNSIAKHLIARHTKRNDSLHIKKVSSRLRKEQRQLPKGRSLISKYSNKATCYSD
jgi:hypothetical protein